MSTLFELKLGCRCSLATVAFLFLLSFFLSVDLIDDGLDALLIDHLRNIACFHDAQFDVPLRFHDLKEGLDSKSHGCLLVEGILVFLLKELPQFFGLLSDGRCLPLANST